MKKQITTAGVTEKFTYVGRSVQHAMYTEMSFYSDIGEDRAHSYSTYCISISESLHHSGESVCFAFESVDTVTVYLLNT